MFHSHPAGNMYSQQLLTVPEAAAYLRISARTLYKNYGKPDYPPAIRVGTRVLFRLCDLERFLDEQTGSEVQSRQRKAN